MNDKKSKLLIVCTYFKLLSNMRNVDGWWGQGLTNFRMLHFFEFGAFRCRLN